jgi:hypothetical protein
MWVLMYYILLGVYGDILGNEYKNDLMAEKGSLHYEFKKIKH